MAGTFAQLSSMIGIPIWIFLVILVWSSVWKLIALWKSARKNRIVWFIVLALINTLGILEILYIYIFSEMKSKPVEEEAPKRKVKRRR
jgi:hypothetical protein